MHPLPLLCRSVSAEDYLEPESGGEIPYFLFLLAQASQLATCQPHGDSWHFMNRTSWHLHYLVWGGRKRMRAEHQSAVPPVNPD
jgi:hypothetical protein